MENTEEKVVEEATVTTEEVTTEVPSDVEVQSTFNEETLNELNDEGVEVEHVCEESN